MAGQSNSELATEKSLSIAVKLLYVSYVLDDLAYENSPLFIILIDFMWPVMFSELIDPKGKLKKLPCLAIKFFKIFYF